MLTLLLGSVVYFCVSVMTPGGAQLLCEGPYVAPTADVVAHEAP